jgi:hypothetical protein
MMRDLLNGGAGSVDCKCKESRSGKMTVNHRCWTTINKEEDRLHGKGVGFYIRCMDSICYEPLTISRLAYYGDGITLQRSRNLRHNFKVGSRPMFAIDQFSSL